MTSISHTSGTDRCGEVIEQYSGFDVVINIQGDEPLIRPEQLDDVVRLFENNNIQIGTLVKRLHHLEDVLNPNRIKVVLDHKNNGIYFSRSPIPFIANTAQKDWMKKAAFWKHIGIYAWRMDVLKDLVKLPKSTIEEQESLEQLRWLYNGYEIATVETEIETPNIDAPEDLKKVLSLLTND
jgi:3-deoxy-manno-octulosonate cytidylyltransferase (CMP-KDO synthetase)